MDIGNGTGEEHLPHNPNVEGSSLLNTTDTRGEIIAEKVYNCSKTVLTAQW